jgi:hypothetical protein
LIHRRPPYGRLTLLSVPPAARRRGVAVEAGGPPLSADNIASAWPSSRETRRRVFTPESGA